MDGYINGYPSAAVPVFVLSVGDLVTFFINMMLMVTELLIVVLSIIFMHLTTV